MPRAKRGFKARRRRNRILNHAEGFWGGRSRLFAVAIEVVHKAWQYAYIGRKRRKRDFRRLWVARINAAARANGTTYPRRMGAVPPADKKRVGEKVNQLRDEVEAEFQKRLAAIEAALRDADLRARPHDLTLPGRSPAPRGHLHPLTRVRRDILQAFRDLGF